MEPARCFNCDLPSIRPFSDSQAEDQRVSLPISVSENFCSTFSSILQSSEPLLCLNCQNVLNILSDSKIAFLHFTKCNSMISGILNVANNNTSKGKTYMYTSINSEESILPSVDDKVENLKVLVNDDDHDIIKSEVLLQVYKEKIPILNITQLTRNTVPLSTATINEENCCNFCQRNFLTKEKKISHIKAVHQNLVHPFECKLCNGKFHQKWFYNYHVRTEHAGMEILFSCTVCQQKCHSQAELDEHKFSAHRQTTHPFKCNHCAVAFQTKEEISLLRKHLIQSHADSNETKAALYNMNYFNEKQKERRGNRRKCGVGSCPRTFCSRLGYAHILFEHYSQKSCTQCQHIFRDETDLMEHSKKCLFTKCSKCGKKMSNLRCLVGHWNSVHASKVDYPFNCEICGNRSNTYRNLVSHYSAYHSVVAAPRQYSCNQCGTFFIQKHGLKQHMLTIHSDKRKLPLKCKSCNARLTENERHHLKAHKCGQNRMTHSCDLCALTFSNYQGLSNHRKIHALGEARRPRVNRELGDHISVNPKLKRKHGCNLCKVTVRHPNEIFLHLLVKHGIRHPLYKENPNTICKLCGKTFKDLKEHQNRVKSCKGPKPMKETSKKSKDAFEETLKKIDKVDLLHLESRKISQRNAKKRVVYVDTDSSDESD